LSACQKTPDLLPDNPYDNPPDTNPPVFAGSHYNIIFILSDDIGYEVPTYSGGQSYSTPSLDFMAANGTQFPECHGNALCSPSRFMLATGKYNFRNYDHWGIMDTSQRTFANLLKDAGALMQTMYLVATAMGLAPCAIGGGDAECFAAAAGTAFWEESSVAEFMLGYPVGRAP